MTHRPSFAILTIALLAFTTFQLASANCATYTSCHDCSSAPSWLDSCRWCPLDQRCHATGAVFTNPCKASENIVDAAQCPAAPNPNTLYNDKIAYDALKYSNAAYATENNVPSIKNAYLSPSFTVVGSPFIFEVPFSLASTCLGYLGVDHIKKQVVVAFRGTLFGKMSDLIAEQLIQQALGGAVDMITGGVQIWPDLPSVKVASYYGKVIPLLNSMAKPALDLFFKNPGYQVLVTGHSLGGSLASIMATHLVKTLTEAKVDAKNVMLITFGQPRTGNLAYANLVDRLLPGRAFRVVANRDIVPNLPPLDKNAPTIGPWHHGTEIWYAAGGFFQDKVPCKYRECSATGEDTSCSRSLAVRLSVVDHTRRYWCALPSGFCAPSTPDICPS